MATVTEIISGALVLLGVRAAESAIHPVEIQNGLTSLNDLMNQLVIEGIDIGFETVEAVDDEIYVDDGAIGPIKALLAEYIDPEYAPKGESLISPTLARRIRAAPTVLRTLVPVRATQFPDSLPTGSGNETNYYNSDGDSAGVFSNRFFSESDDKCS